MFYLFQICDIRFQICDFLNHKRHKRSYKFFLLNSYVALLISDVRFAIFNSDILTNIDELSTFNIQHSTKLLCQFLKQLFQIFIFLAHLQDFYTLFLCKIKYSRAHVILCFKSQAPYMVVNIFGSGYMWQAI